jgi:ribose transport system substrate-binding protein
MQRPASPWIGSVSHEAGTYGPRLIHLGLSILRGLTVPPYNYVEHKLVTAEMVRRGIGAGSQTNKGVSELALSD